MPYWFQFSKNQRKQSKRSSEKKYAEPNNSTMNRICKAFEDIGNINMNFAGIAQFNWQMLLSEPCLDSCPEIPLLFCKMDDGNISNEIMSEEQVYVSERQLMNGIQMTAEDIIAAIEEKYGLETAYPYIVKYLFAGEGVNRAAHKQMFWKVFGDIALRNLRTNLDNCYVCADCGMKIPSLVETHVCSKNSQGFYQCVECGRMCERTNARQYRCVECQKEYRNMQKRIQSKEIRTKKKELDASRIMRLGSYLKDT